MENIGAVDIILTSEEIEAIETAVPIDAVKGERYPEAGMVGIDG